MKQLSATTTGNTMTAQEVSLQEEKEETVEQQRLRGYQSQEIMVLHDEISTLSLNGGHISPPPHASLAAPESTNNSLIYCYN